MNGFNLTAGQSAYPDIHPSFDHTTKTSPYTQLESGPIIFGLSLYDGGDKLSCASKDMVYNKEHTAIKLDIALPEFKR